MKVEAVVTKRNITKGKVYKVLRAFVNEYFIEADNCLCMCPVKYFKVVK